MELKVFNDHEAQSAAAADMIVDRIMNKPGAVLCFASGDSPRLAYQKAAERVRSERVDISNCLFIGLDEWLGIPPDNSGSCHYFLQHYLFGPMNIDPAQIHLFNGMTTDEDKECERMNNVIAMNGGIDLVVVGVGMNGHIGFNEPGTDIETTAHVAMLDEITRTVGKKYFNEPVPINKGITVGLKQVMEAGTLLMMANGKKKAPVIKRAVEGDTGTEFPASLVRKHANGILMIDAEAAAELKTHIK